MGIERRRYDRRIPPDNAFVALGRHYTRVGRIINIARGGLAFEYIAGEDIENEDSQVDIFLTGNVFHLYSIPCQVIYLFDVHVPHVNNKYIKLLTRKRCGLKFKNLSSEEQYQLYLFIEAHTAF